MSLHYECWARLECRCKQMSFCVVKYNKKEKKAENSILNEMQFKSKWRHASGNLKKVSMFVLWVRTWKYQRTNACGSGAVWTNYRDHPQTWRKARINFHLRIHGLLLEYGSIVENVAALYFFKCLICNQMHKFTNCQSNASFYNNIIISVAPKMLS